MPAQKDQYEVVRSTTISAPPAKVHGLITDFHEWTKWSPWEDLDPELERTYSGSGSGAGSVYEWSGNRKAGEGRMEITEDAPPSRVVIALDFIKPFKSSNTTTFEIEGDGDGSRVTWRMVGPKTLATKIMGIFKSMDKMVGPDFEKGLSRMKAAAEG
jgi:uncharacterized protein YndB with AHSA1/START domain